MFAPNGGLVMMVQPPAVQGVGSFGGFAFMLQDSAPIPCPISTAWRTR